MTPVELDPEVGVTMSVTLANCNVAVEAPVVSLPS